MSSVSVRALLVAGLIAAAGASLAGFAQGAGSKLKNPARTNSYVQVTLKQQLEKGLKCRRPVEFEFVERVTTMVEDGELPIRLVNIAFAWSRKRDSFRPFMYFERALIELARRENIVVDPVPLKVITETKAR